MCIVFSIHQTKCFICNHCDVGYNFIDNKFCGGWGVSSYNSLIVTMDDMPPFSCAILLNSLSKEVLPIPHSPRTRKWSHLPLLTSSNLFSKNSNSSLRPANILGSHPDLGVKGFGFGMISPVTTVTKHCISCYICYPVFKDAPNHNHKPHPHRKPPPPP